MKKSLDALCKEISESKDLADRTLRRRFMKLLECAHGNVEHLKNPQGNIIFEGEQIKFMTALLEGLATNNSLTLQFIDAPGRKTFRDYHSFLQKLMENMTAGMEDPEEIQRYVNYIGMIFMGPWHNSLSECYRMMDLFFNSLIDMPYTHQSIIAEKAEHDICRMTVDRLVENAMYIHELADMMLLAEDISEESIDASWYGDDEIAREYSERDRKVYFHLMEDKYLRQYIEESVGKSVEEIFPAVAKRFSC